jgi:uncharacterized protein (TIRG00374 family)
VRAQAVRVAVGGVIAAILLSWFFRGLDWGALGSALRGAHPSYLAALVVLTVLTYLVRAWRWGYLLSPLGRVGLGDLFSATMVGFASGLLVPRAGEIVRPYLISRRHPIATSSGFATVILERLSDLLTVLALFAAYVFVLPAPAAQAAGPVGLLKAGGAVTGLLAVALVVLLAAFHAHAERALTAIEMLLRRLPVWLARRAGQALRTFAGGLAVLQAPAAHLAVILAQSLLLWLLIALAFHCAHLAFGLGLPFHATLLLIAFLTVGVAIPTPGMVGGFHAFYLLCLHEVFGVERGSAAAVGIAAHALSNLPVLALGLALLGREGLTLRRVAQMTGEQELAQEVRT